MKQEPVGWIVDGIFFDSLGAALNMSLNFEQPCIPLYTAPRELSDEEIWELHQEYIDEVPCGHSMQTVGFIEFAKAILKKASEK
jgi:hypothetical protein